MLVDYLTIAARKSNTARLFKAREKLTYYNINKAKQRGEMYQSMVMRQAELAVGSTTILPPS